MRISKTFMNKLTVTDIKSCEGDKILLSTKKCFTV